MLLSFALGFFNEAHRRVESNNGEDKMKTCRVEEVVLSKRVTINYLIKSLLVNLCQFYNLSRGG